MEIPCGGLLACFEDDPSNRRLALGEVQADVDGCFFPAATRDRSIEERVFKPQKVDQLVKENIRRKKELGLKKALKQLQEESK